MAVSEAHYRQGMRQLAAAVTVITAAHEGARNGLTATAAMSVCAEPPRLAIAVNKSASALPFILGAGAFAVNVLRYDQDAIASRFASSKTRGEARFEHGAWGVLDTGAPVLHDAAASFDCVIESAVEIGTHLLLIGDVRALRVNPGDHPLLFLDGEWASLIQANSAAIEQYGATVAQSIKTVDQAAAHAGSPTDKLRMFVKSFTSLNLAHSPVTRSFFHHEPYLPSAKLAEINAAKNQFDQGLRALLEEGMRSGDFDIDDASVTALAITGMVSWTHRWYSEEGRDTPEQIGEKLAAMAMAMVHARSVEPAAR
ncbi:flavin reductase [Caballeronia sp. LZ065]|uniref:flavin reductase n=1 Tax=Caballeronia sp. LZ065 TaxID=3038571 RepID=UPI00285E269A|nr:flavin reductase [Caballeronia sp. LZ065]MDR5780813.1 flavin reductase [Caballeronia sp. LZ065]